MSQQINQASDEYMSNEKEKTCDLKASLIPTILSLENQIKSDQILRQEMVLNFKIQGNNGSQIVT